MAQQKSPQFAELPALPGPIDLGAYVDKPIAVLVKGKRFVNTRFGEREMMEVKIWTEKSGPDVGVVFAAHFARLEPDRLYASVLRRKGNRWQLDPVTNSKTLLALWERANAGAGDDDIPF